jgi:ketosteroid isomerase-like protein
MSENLDLVRSMFDGWARGELDPADWAHPDIEFEEPDGPDARSVKGIDALRQRIRDFLDKWKEWRMEAETVRELEDGRVLVLTRITGQGSTAGAQIGQTRATLLTFEDGKVVRYLTYWNRGHGLADFGLEELGDARYRSSSSPERADEREGARSER